MLGHRLVLAFDALRESRRYPFEITLNDFVVIKDGPGRFSVQLVGYGNNIRKAEEEEILRDMRKDLGIRYETIRDAIKEEMQSTAAIFFDKALYQTRNATLRAFLFNGPILP